MASLKSKIKFNKIRNTGEKLKSKLKREKNDKTKKSKDKDKKPKNKRKIWYWILSIITCGAILVFALAIIFAIYILYL